MKVFFSQHDGAEAELALYKEGTDQVKDTYITQT